MDESCSRHCGYYDSGQGLIDHERHEHRPCPECGAGNDDGQDGDLWPCCEHCDHAGNYSHLLACPHCQWDYAAHPGGPPGGPITAASLPNRITED